MKILRFVYEWPPPWDGLAPGIYELTKAQVELGNNVVVFCSGGGPIPREVHIHRFPRALKRFSLFLTTAPAVLVGYLFYRLTHRIDIVHGHGHITFWFNIYKLLFGWLDKTPYVLQLHITAAGREIECQRSGEKLDFWTRYFEWPLHRFSDWLGVRVADRVICVSCKISDEAIENYHADPERLVVIENGVNTEVFAPRKNFQSAPGGPIRPGRTNFQILCVGALSPRKNTHLLIEAMRFLPDDCHLTIVGRGAREYGDELRRLVENLKLQNRVEFKGYIKYPNLPPLYQDADIFVLPSSYEGLPKVVLEALSCGTPVLASGFTIKEKISGLDFLGKLEPEILAAEIKRVVESGKEVDVDLVRQKYSWKVKAKAIQKIYDRIRRQ